MPPVPNGTCVTNNRPSLSKNMPLAPFVFSMNVETVSSLSILIVRLAVVSEKMTLPSGRAMVPSLPLKPSFMTWTVAPGATTPGMAVASVSAAGG